MADEQSDHDALITRFVGMSDIASNEVARRYLEANQWNLESAVMEYYTSQEEAAVSNSPILSEEDPGFGSENQPPTHSVPGGGYTLGSGSTPQPIPTTSSLPPPPSSNSKDPPKKKFATLGDIGGGGGASHAGHGHDDGDDDDDDQDFFAGGEKSGLAVQNPDEMKRKILERARKNIPRPGGDDSVAASHFTGSARTLGGDDTPSQLIEDPAASKPRKAPRIKRTLHFWEDGFSVDDGELYRLDDPANAEILRQIKQGSAPLSIMNVERQQEIDVGLEQHQGKYVAPKKKYKPFSGGGQRLGSPTPGPGTSSESSLPPATVDPSLSQQSESAPASVEVDDSEPTISLQIRLGDGTRLVSRFNVTHTIGDVYSFVAASSTASQGRAWVLMTTFPSKELQDKAQILGDLAEFKRGGVVVQKWQ